MLINTVIGCVPALYWVRVTVSVVVKGPSSSVCFVSGVRKRVLNIGDLQPVVTVLIGAGVSRRIVPV